MVFDDLFQRFLEAVPACVMHRALMENILAPEKLDAVFHQAAEKQYEQELLFSTLVDLTSQVVCRASAKSAHRVYESRERITVSLTAVYEKLKGVELQTSRALVQHTAGQVGELIRRCKGSRKRCCRVIASGSWMAIISAKRSAASRCCGARRRALCRGKRWCCSIRN